MLKFSQDAFSQHALVLVSMESVRAVFGAELAARELERQLISHILNLSFADQDRGDEKTISHTSVVFAFPHHQDASSTKPHALHELVFPGNSVICLELALAYTSHADSMLVVGTRSRDQVKRMAQQYFRRLDDGLCSAQKDINW